MCGFRNLKIPSDSSQVNAPRDRENRNKITIGMQSTLAAEEP